MKQEFFNLQINTNGQKLYEFTDQTLDWINENTHPYEYDTECENWEFYPTKGTPNGHMLNCYPEHIIWKDEVFLKTLKDLVS